jgi:holo-[acyl-carrier protein] synthase
MVRVGVDLVAVADVARSVDRFGQRYLDRLFSAREQADCAGAPAVRAAGLAARFAAKEAFRKVLRSAEHQPPWWSVEVRRTAWGGGELHLAPDASRCAVEEGIVAWTLSMSHEAGMAAAVVAARCCVADVPPRASGSAQVIGDRWTSS